MSNTIITNLGGETFDVTQFAVGTIVKGKAIPGAATVVAVFGVVLPLKPTEIAVLQAGQDVSAGIVIYTEAVLKTASEVDRTGADEVAWDGRVWRVHSVERRPQFAGLEHYRAVALLKDDAG